MRFKTLPIFPAFFLMGLADAMGATSDGVKKQYKLSGLMCMAISGGAIPPLLMGWLLDRGWKEIAFGVSEASFRYLFLLSLKGGRKSAAPAWQESEAIAD